MRVSAYSPKDATYLYEQVLNVGMHGDTSPERETLQAKCPQCGYMFTAVLSVIELPERANTA